MGLKYSTVRLNSNRTMAGLFHYRYGEPHRIDGPARIYNIGMMSYVEYGDRYTKSMLRCITIF